MINISLLSKLTFLAFLALIFSTNSYGSTPKCYEDIENPLLHDVWIPATTIDQQNTRLQNICYLKAFPEPVMTPEINGPRLFLGAIPKDVAIEKVLPYLGINELKALKAVTRNDYAIMHEWQNKLIAAQRNCILKGLNNVTHAEKDLLKRYEVKLIPIFIGRASPNKLAEIKNLINNWRNAQGMQVMSLCCFTKGPLTDMLITSIIKQDSLPIIMGLSMTMVLGSILFIFGSV